MVVQEGISPRSEEAGVKAVARGSGLERGEAVKVEDAQIEGRPEGG